MENEYFELLDKLEAALSTEYDRLCVRRGLWITAFLVGCVAVPLFFERVLHTHFPVLLGVTLAAGSVALFIYNLVSDPRTGGFDITSEAQDVVRLRLAALTHDAGLDGWEITDDGERRVVSKHNRFWDSFWALAYAQAVTSSSLSPSKRKAVLTKARAAAAPALSQAAKLAEQQAVPLAQVWMHLMQARPR